jgi:hypothetical protein
MRVMRVVKREAEQRRRMEEREARGAGDDPSRRVVRHVRGPHAHRELHRDDEPGVGVNGAQPARTVRPRRAERRVERQMRREERQRCEGGGRERFHRLHAPLRRARRAIRGDADRDRVARGMRERAEQRSTRAVALEVVFGERACVMAHVHSPHRATARQHREACHREERVVGAASQPERAVREIVRERERGEEERERRGYAERPGSREHEEPQRAREPEAVEREIDVHSRTHARRRLRSPCRRANAAIQGKARSSRVSTRLTPPTRWTAT